VAGDVVELKPLSAKHQVFVNKYLELWNGTKAYQIAYPGTKEVPARTSAARLLADANIKAQIDIRLSEMHMRTDEALSRMADMARADVGDFIDIIDTQDKSWEVNLFEMDPDTGEIRTKKNTKLIKKLKRKEVTDKFGNTVVEVEIELHDPQAALDKILRVSGAYKDNLDLTTGGERITVRLVSDATD
jgi:phage terminase small subunit